MSLAFLFPGQGSQCLGMGNELFERFQSLTTEASEYLGYSLSSLCADGPEEKLSQTQFTQPALYVASYLNALAQTEDGNVPKFAAGHSVGEFASLACAGVFSFIDGLKMVAKRGEIMSQVSGGAMAAVIGMDPAKLSDLIKEEGFENIDLANFNSPGQIVISGSESEIRSSLDKIKSGGAKLVVPLKVSGAFHSRMMKEPASEFKTFLDDFSFSTPNFPVFANVSAEPYSSAKEIPELLVKQMYSPVLWTQTIQNMKKAGVEEFIECGPGKVLSKLLRQIP